MDEVLRTSRVRAKCFVLTGVSKMFVSKVVGLLSFKTPIYAPFRPRDTGQTERLGNESFKA